MRSRTEGRALKPPRIAPAAFFPLALAAALLAGCSGVGEDKAFFGGKTITIIVPHGQGGMDVYARAIAPYLQKYLPGSKVEVSNIPGGGGIEGRNRVYAAAPDGLTLGFTTGGGLLLAEWSGNPAVRYKTADFAWLGRINAEAHVLAVAPRSGFSSLEDILAAGRIRVGFAGLGSDDYFSTLVTAKVLGFTVEPHTEFTGNNDAGLACVRGDIDGIVFSVSSVLPQIRAGTLLPLTCFGPAGSPELPGVLPILDSLPAGQRSHLGAIYAIYAVERVLFAPPGLPPRRLRALRAALDRGMADPEFRHNLGLLKRPLSYLPGAATAELFAGIMAQEDSLKPLVGEIAGNKP